MKDSAVSVVGIIAAVWTTGRPELVLDEVDADEEDDDEEVEVGGGLEE